MTLAAILTAVATLIVGHHTPVTCNHPAGTPWAGNVYGWTVWRPHRPAHVYLRACGATVRRQPRAVTLFAHELLHVEHPTWPHPRVYRYAPWYAKIVDRALAKVEAGE